MEKPPINYKENLFFGARKEIFRNANQLRQPLTKAEEILWEALRNRKLNNIKFRRQHPINKYIADFYCPAHHLAIELDGGIHDDEGNQEYDAGRSFELKELGIRVIRFHNAEIFDDLQKVLTRILNEIEKLKGI